MSMGSVNISITDDIYSRLSRRKGKDESFSMAIGRLLGKRDITRCYGLLKNNPKAIRAMRESLRLSRSAEWRDIR